MKVSPHPQSVRNSVLRPCATVVAAILALAMIGSAHARDDSAEYSIAEAMNTSTAKALEGVSFYFGGQSHPEVKKHIGNYSSRRTTNAFGKSDADACQWAFLSAIKTFYERAQKEGGNAVINLKSVTTGETHSSDTTYVCRAGNVVAKVYLTGDVVSF